MHPWTLKYLFGVRYSDGSEFHQTPEDVSQTDPKRSAFYDVHQDEVELFQLAGPIGERDAEHRWLVDLRDGHFEVDGAPFWVDLPEMPEGGRLRLVYFRRHTHQIGVSGENWSELSHQIEYGLGWQATGADGRNYQYLIFLR